MHTRSDREPTSFWLGISPDVRVEIVCEGGRLLGLGALEIGGVPVRASAAPIRPDFSTPDAIHYQDFLLLEVAREDGGVVLRTNAIGRPASIRWSAPTPRCSR